MTDDRRFEFRYDRWCGWLLGLLGMGRRFSSVMVDGDRIAVSMGWSFGASIPRSSIVSVERVSGPVFGWGVHGWRGRWLVNGSSQGLVELRIEPPAPCRVIGVPVRLRRLRVSLIDPDGFLAHVV